MTMNHFFHIFDGVQEVYIKFNDSACVHHFEIDNTLSTKQTSTQIKRALPLDVVVGESAAVLQLLAGEDEALLVGGYALLVLDLGLDGVNVVEGLDFEGDGLAGQRLHEHLQLRLFFLNYRKGKAKSSG